VSGQKGEWSSLTTAREARKTEHRLLPSSDAEFDALLEAQRAADKD
jgi:hypothetical protein